MPNYELDPAPDSLTPTNPDFSEKIILARRIRDATSITTNDSSKLPEPPSIDEPNDIAQTSQATLTDIPAATDNNNDHASSSIENVDIDIDPLSTQKRKKGRRSSNSSSTIDVSTTKKPKADAHSLPVGIHNAIIEFCDSEANSSEIQAINLIEFISELQHTTVKSIDLADYTDDKESFIHTIKELHKTLKHKGTKNRLMRVINSHSSTNSQISDDDSDLSI